jgi:hypothetical protein
VAALKPDASQIREFLKELAERDWIKRTQRRWWPTFVFHYTDIRNAVQALQDGYLYSREYLEANDRLPVSSGSPRVLAGTDTGIKDCVRLYFRPQTPTQFYAEGIRSKATLAVSKFPDAHCPVPVFFLFDSAQILIRADCRFSDGNLGSARAQILSTAAELEQLPWPKIYHTGWYSKSENVDISFRRCAEVIIPRRLDLNALRYIYCRSEAERETLLHLLPQRLRKKYQDKVVATTRSFLFFRRQTFIETARLSSKAVHLQFSPETESPGPFFLLVELETATDQLYMGVEDFQLGPNYKKVIRLPATSYTIHLYLDDHLAYANKHEDIAIPF